MKRDIRQAGLAALKALPMTLRKDKSKVIVAQTLVELKPYQRISVFESFDWEVDTHPLIEALQQEGKVVYVPKVLSPEEMVMINIETSEVVNKDEIDAIVIPCVCFWDKYRIGYGRGYYDRYLKDYQGFKLLIAFQEQERQFTPDSFDVPFKKKIVF